MEILICFLIAFIVYFDIWPILNKKIKRLEKPILYDNLLEVYTQVFRSSLIMLESKKIKMSFNEEHDFYSFLSKVKRFLKRDKSYDKYRYYNFPRAWLMIGLLDSYESDKKESTLTKLNHAMEKLVDNSGNILFNFDKLDQVLFGMVFIRMYEATGEERFIKCADTLYERLHNFDSDGLLLYRKGLTVYFTDSIGMSVPFLYKYYNNKSDIYALTMARKQIDFYIENGLEIKNKFPFHAIDLSTNVRLGSINWARGIAWFLIGLSYAIKYEVDEIRIIKYTSLYEDIVKKLQSISENGCYWPQFIGHTNNESIDSSATLMIYYSMKICGYDAFDFSNVSNSMKACIDKNGMVLNSSGDTIYINRYSTIQSLSEVSQGLLLSLLSKEQSTNENWNSNITTME